MKIYDEFGTLLLTEPDLEKGWLYTEQKLVAHHPAKEEKSHLEVMLGTDGLRRKVVDTAARQAWDEYETVQIYRLYTPEELAERNKPSLEERISNAENALMELMLGGV